LILPVHPLNIYVLSSLLGGYSKLKKVSKKAPIKNNLGLFDMLRHTMVFMVFMVFMVYYGILWYLWYIMVYYGILWYIMVYYGILTRINTML
jgi:hypothetical protein